MFSVYMIYICCIRFCIAVALPSEILREGIVLTDEAYAHYICCIMHDACTLILGCSYQFVCIMYIMTLYVLCIVCLSYMHIEIDIS